MNTELQEDIRAFLEWEICHKQLLSKYWFTDQEMKYQLYKYERQAVYNDDIVTVIEELYNYLITQKQIQRNKH